MSNKRTIFLLILLLLVGALGYSIIYGGEESTVLDTSEEPVISEQVNKMLNDITDAKLDTSVLSSPQLLELFDFSLPLIGVPIGRPNPFAGIK